MNQRIKYWIDLADYDLETARAMLKTKRYLYVGFMCHQTIEKAIKAIISKKNGNTLPPKIHNLIRLSNMGEIYNELSENQRKLLATLNPLNVEARYPEYKDGVNATLNNDKCTNLLTETEELLYWIKQRL